VPYARDTTSRLEARDELESLPEVRRRDGEAAVRLALPQLWTGAQDEPVGGGTRAEGAEEEAPAVGPGLIGPYLLSQASTWSRLWNG
jgi:hypothetical protein